VHLARSLRPCFKSSRVVIICNSKYCVIGYFYHRKTQRLQQDKESVFIVFRRWFCYGFAKFGAARTTFRMRLRPRGEAASTMADLFSLPADSAARSADDDELRGRIGRVRASKTGRGVSGALGARLTKALKGQRIRGSRHTFSFLGGVPNSPFASDPRQRVVVKMSFRNHGHGAGGAAGGGGNGGGGKLMAHASYLERDGAAREGERGHFYDREQERAEDARERLQEWSAEDKRHFRLMLAPECGARLVGEDGDLKSFTREVMERMERDLGVKLDWVAVDHHNTDNPHAHVIIRGVRRDGVELILPREYISHGLREAARDVATELIGERSRADERLKLQREIEGRGFNQLDRTIEQQLDQRREILMQELGRGHSPEFANALKARAQELARLGLAEEMRRNVLRFERDWVERLEAARPHDVRRELARSRLYEPHLGRVVGQVRELGPRGENPDRGLLVIETPEHGRLLLNTSMEAISDLQKGSLVALEPDGKRAAVERLSYHSLQAQIPARAETELDRELDLIARGAQRRLPATKEVEAALRGRAELLEQNGYGVRSESGKFYFRDGARDGLRQAELEREGADQARERGGVFRDPARDMGDDLGKSTWTVCDVKELFSGRTAVLQHGREVALHPIGRDPGINVGDRVAFKAIDRGLGLEAPRQMELVKVMGRGLGLGR
jgi:type IV secretory pathway VirD2 relaxase